MDKIDLQDPVEVKQQTEKKVSETSQKTRNTSLSKLKDKLKFSKVNLVVFATIFAVIGTVSLLNIFAATTTQLAYNNDFSNQSDLNRLYKVIHDGGGNFAAYNQAHTFHGDHDLACGPPTTTRLIDTNGAQDQYSTYRNEDLFWYCAPGSEPTKGHFMTGLDTGNYVSIAFSPMNAAGNGPMLFDNPTEICWDVNVTDLAHRKWNELIITPESVIQGLGNQPNIGRFANPNFIANAGPDGVLPNNGTFLFSNIEGNTQYFKNGSETFNDIQADYYSEITAAISGNTDKASRYKTCIKDNRNGTVTRTQAVPGSRTITVTGNGSFPTGKAAVIFKDVSYNVLKAYENEGATKYVTDPFTWHWDNIQVYNTSDTTTVPADTTKPNVSLTSPANSANFSSGDISLTAVATDNVGVNSVEFFIDGQLKGQGSLTSTANTYSLAVASSGLANGTHTIYAVAKDTAGNTQQSTTNSITISTPIDSTAPAITLTSPSNNATYTSGNGSLNYSATATDNFGISSVEFFLDSAKIANGVSSGNNTYTISQSISGLTIGSHTIFAVAKDAAGNSKQSSTVTVSITQAADSTPPTVTLTSPTSGSTVTGTVTVSSTASDNIGVVSVSYYLDGSTTPFSTDTTSPYTSSWNSATASNGTHSVIAKATDSSGNNASTSSTSFTVSNTIADTTAPTTKITDPLNGAVISGSKVVAATATDNVGISKVELIIDGTVRATDTTSPYSFNFSTTSYSDGNHVLQTKAFDAASNSSSSSSVTVTVANNVTPPTTGAKPGDVNLDGKVNREDSRIVRRNLGKTPATRADGDLNGDNIVNYTDLVIVYINWRS